MPTKKVKEIQKNPDEAKIQIEMIKGACIDMKENLERDERTINCFQERIGRLENRVDVISNMINDMNARVEGTINCFQERIDNESERTEDGLSGLGRRVEQLEDESEGLAGSLSGIRWWFIGGVCTFAVYVLSMILTNYMGV